MAAISKRPKLNGLLNRIKLVGIELEGGWDEPPKGESIIKDGSVKFPPASNVRASFQDESTTPMNITVPFPAPQFKGEIASKPMSIDKMGDWVRHAYPRYVNETCGLHIHMSFHYRINYSRLMTPDFTPFIVKKVIQFAEAEKLPKDHPQWPRILKKDHHHCAHLYLAEGQAKATRKDYESRGKPHSRYTFVNYCESQHHTIEVRGLSMFQNADQAIRALMAVLDGTNEFLSKIRQKERPERASVKARPEVTQEFRSFLRAA